MFKFNSKKGDWDGIGKIITFLIGIIVMIFCINYFMDSGGKANEVVSNQISNLGNCDGDDVANTWDKCPCIKIGNEENPDLKGCPKSVTNATECTDEQKEVCDDKGTIF